MNYIHQLQDELSKAKAKLIAVDNLTLEFRAHLQSAKFAGPCENYISTNDVKARLAAIRSVL